MGAGPHSGVHGLPANGQPEAFGAAQWPDNVARMHQFVQAHPEVSITTPRQNGTGEFMAVWVEPSDGAEGTRVQLSDRHLGWLMDRVEEQFAGR